MAVFKFDCGRPGQSRAVQSLRAALLVVSLLLLSNQAGIAQQEPPKQMILLQTAKRDAVTQAFVKFYVHGQADREKSEAFKLAKEADLAFKKGDAQKSHDLYTKAIASLQKPEEKALMTSQDAINYRLSNIYLARGTCSMSLKDKDAALADFTAAQNCCPGYRLPYIYKARTHMDLKDKRNFASVMKVAMSMTEYPPFLEKALKTDPGYIKATQAFSTALDQEVEKMQDERQKKIFVNGKKGFEASKMDKFYEQGQKLLAQNKYSLAIDAFSNAIKTFDTPAEKALYTSKEVANFIGSWNFEHRGYCYLMIKEYKKAVDDLNKAIALWPNCQETYINRGKALKILGRTAESQADFEKASKLKPQMQPAVLQK